MDAQSDGKSVVKTTIGYSDPSSTTATGQVKTWKSGATTYTYAYDARGNITSVSDGQSTTTYAYDSFDQLVRENNQAAGKTWTYAYDDGGNIQSKTEYAYTTGALGAAVRTVAYGYDSDGKRITKTVNGTTYNYHYLGDQLVELTWGGNKLHFTYDSTGPLSVNYNGTEYFYVKNAQGDVTGLVSASGTRVVTYTYDAWGNPLSTTGSLATTLGEQNPLRYRGYVYDTETGLYYLQSRYYNPTWGRFINADSLIDNRGVHTQNVFAYCGNNPIIRTDGSGNIFHLVVGALVGAALSGVAKVVSNAIDRKPLTSGLGRSMLFGALGGALAASGAGLLTMVLGGAAIAAAENATDQIIRNNGLNGFNTKEMLYESGKGAAFAFIGGPGSGSKNLNRLGLQTLKRTGREIAENGLLAGLKEAKKAFSYYLKNTSKYYKNVIKDMPGDTIMAIVNGAISTDRVNNNVRAYFKW